jgi:hypothetical protein
MYTEIQKIDIPWKDMTLKKYLIPDISIILKIVIQNNMNTWRECK